MRKRADVEERSNAAAVSEWARARLAMARAFLEWLAETARLDQVTVHELDRFYPGVETYAARGRPLLACSPADLATLAECPRLVIDDDNLEDLVTALRALADRSAAERGLLAALLGHGQWARARLAMARAFLEWLAETARLDDTTMRELEDLYPGLRAYAQRARPLRECSPADLATLAEYPRLLINEKSLADLVPTLRASDEPSPAERGLLAALLGRALREPSTTPPSKGRSLKGGSSSSC